jgi:hypothetical protein
MACRSLKTDMTSIHLHPPFKLLTHPQEYSKSRDASLGVPVMLKLDRTAKRRWMITLGICQPRTYGKLDTIGQLD